MMKHTYQIKVIIGEVETEGPHEDVALAYEKALKLKSDLLYSYDIINVVRKAEIHLESR
jgi:hypothetical protein